MMPAQKPIADPSVIKDHLRHTFRRWHEIDVDCVFEVRLLTSEDEASVKNVARFRPSEDGISDASDHIAAMNAYGLNAYIVVNPIRANADIKAGQGAKDEHIAASFFHWADADDAQAAENIRTFVGPRPTFFVLTGKSPCPRPHVYWELEKPETDLVAWKARQQAIAATLKSDPSVVNPSRIMRVGGTVNWPKPKKIAKGYIQEVTELHIHPPSDRPLVSADRMTRAFIAAPQQTTGTGFHIDTGDADRKSADQYSDILRRARTDGEKHTGVRDLAASLAGAGVPRALAESIIREACPVWDECVVKLIDTAYAKFGHLRLEETPQAQEMRAQAEGVAWPTQYDFFDATALQPRQWIYGRHYLRRFVSVLASAGGIGKTSLQIVEALAICTGRPLLGEEVCEPCNVWLINLEDPMDEMQRRILAAMQHYGIKPEEVRGKLFVDAGRDFALTFAVQTREGVTPNAALVDHLIKRIPELQIGAVFIDPFVGAHQINENDNMAVNAVVAQVRKVADETNCAVGLVHHIRKGNGEDATIDSVRGAGSLIGAARAARVINKVSEQDAIGFGVDPKEARGLFRVDDGKANLAPPASAAVFRRMEGVQIANGEWVGVTLPYALPDEWGGIGPDQTNDMLRIIGMGIPDADGNEEYYSIRPQDKDRWVGTVITSYAFDNPDHAKNAGQAKRILTQWIKNGFIEEQSYHSVRQRKERKGVFVKGRAGEQL